MAAVGRAGERELHPEQRTDSTLWLDGSGPAQGAFFELIDALRLELNRELFLGLFDYEAHYAHYAPGAFYRRHLDTFRERDPALPQRLLSAVFYLNDHWQPGDGGELVIWRDDREIARIEPRDCAAVFFLSAEIPHEVLPSRGDRYSIACWFRSAAAA